MPSKISHQMLWKFLSLTQCLVLLAIMVPAATPRASAASAPSAQAAGSIPSPSPFYRLKLIGMEGDTDATGQPITTIANRVSINDRGDVAFTGVLSIGSALFVGNGTSAPRDIAPALHSTLGHSFGYSPHLNDQGVVTVKRTRSSSSGPIEDLLTLDAAGTDVVLRSHAQSGDDWTYPFAALDENATTNNAGKTVHYAQPKGSAGCLPHEPGCLTGPFHLLAETNMSEPVPQVEKVLNPDLHPVLADDADRLVVRFGGLATSPIRLYEYNLQSYQDIACAPGGSCAHPGFTELGASPGISEDGTIVAFSGVVDAQAAAALGTSAGAGIFLSVAETPGARRLVRISGSQIEVGGDGDGMCEAAETCRPMAELGLDAAGNPLHFASYVFGTRVGIIRQALGAPGIVGDSFVVAFAAAPNAASRPNPAAPGKPLLFTEKAGLWTVRVDVQRHMLDTGISYHPTAPTKVLQIGDVVGTNTITNIGLHDQISSAATDANGVRTQRRGDHRLGFHVNTTTGMMVLKAERLDSDQDGLMDHWETEGLDMDGDGAVDLNLPAMQADPNKRDLYLELDWVVDRPGAAPNTIDRTSAPAPGLIHPLPHQAKAPLVDMFDQAPLLSGVANGVTSDGSPPAPIPAGITLHIDGGPEVDATTNSRRFSLNMGSSASLLDGGDRIAAAGDTTGKQPVDVVYHGLPGAMQEPGITTRSFHEIKDTFFGHGDKWARELAFHYVVMADAFAFKDVTGAYSESTPYRAQNVLTASNTATAIVLPDVTNPGSTFTKIVPATMETTFPIPFNPGGDAILITAGTGAGQIRAVAGQDVSRKNLIGLRDPWATPPGPDSEYVVLAGYAGRAERDERPAPAANGTPGNDVLLTLGAYSTSDVTVPGGYYFQWRVLAHELGHNLGLGHCPRNTNETVCSTDMAAYRSLMSYAHQNASPTLYFKRNVVPVTSFAGASDVLYDDWTNLRMDLHATAHFVGNTFARSFGAQPVDDDPGLTPGDFERVQGTLLDDAEPTVTLLSPDPSGGVALGEMMVVDVRAVDDDAVTSIFVSFDTQADGGLDPWDQGFAQLVGEGIYRVTLDRVMGIEGPRTLRVLATDPSGNVTRKEVAIQVRRATATLSPATATKRLGADHTLTATVREGVTEEVEPIPNTPVVFTVVEGPHKGRTQTITTGADGTATFTYVGEAQGVDRVEATFTDSIGTAQSSNVARVEWLANRIPVASNLAGSTSEDVAVSAPLTASDAEGDPLSFAVTEQPAHGTLSGTEPNLTYTPDANYNGPDSFSYTASDPEATSQPATVSITVQPVNDPPVATPDSRSAEHGQPLVFPAAGLAANDSKGPANEAGQSLTVTAVAGGAQTHGDVALLPTGDVQYVPEPGYVGIATFSYTVCDDGTTAGSPDAKCATGAVNVTVQAPNNPPVANNLSVETDEDVAATVSLAATDADGNPLTYVLITPPAHGLISGVAPALTYTPAANYHGADSFTYRASDGKANSNVATVSITVRSVNDDPAAKSDTAQTGEGAAKVIDVLANDTDVDGDTLTVTHVGPAAHGLATLITTEPDAGKILYIPQSGFGGSDSFAYTVSDGAGGSSSATVSVQIELSSGFALAVAPAAQAVVPGKSAGYSVAVSPLAGFNAPVTLSVSGLPAGVTGSIAPATLTPPGNAVLTIAAAAGAPTGSFGFTVTATGGGITRTAGGSVTVDFGLVPECFGAFTGTVKDARTGQVVAGATVTRGGNSVTTDVNGTYLIKDVPLNTNNFPKTYGLTADKAGYWYDQAPGVAVCGEATTVNLQLVPRDTGTVSGTVYVGIADPDDSSPQRKVTPTTQVLAGATVVIEGKPYTTDSQGRYQSAPLQMQYNNQPKSYTGRATAGGHWYGDRSFAVEANKNTVVDFALVPVCRSGAVSGSVTWLDPPTTAGGADVVLAGEETRSTTADTSGEFSFEPVLLGYNNSARNYVVTATKAGDGGTHRKDQTITLGGCETPALVALHLQPPAGQVPNYGMVEGVVLDDETNKPVANAFVKVSSATESVVTNDQGRYALRVLVGFNNQTSSTVSLVANATGYWTGSGAILVEANKTSPLTLRVLKKQFGALEGTVRDVVTGQPITGAKISVGSTQTTGAGGTFGFDGLELEFGNKPREYAVQTSAEGYWPSAPKAIVSAGLTTPVDVKLLKVCKGASITGRVVSAANGQEIQGARVTAGGKTAYTDQNGLYSLSDLTPGTNNTPLELVVMASADGFITQSKTITIFCGASIVIDFGGQDTLFGAIDGTVTDVATGKPIAGAFVGSGFGGSTLTNATGYYKLTGVPLAAGGGDRTWEVTAAPDGYAAQTQSVEARAGQTSQLNFRFGNGAPVVQEQALATDEDTTTEITLTATDADGDELTYAVVAQPQHGTFSGTAPNLTYTPDANYSGSDSFTYKANDGTEDSNVATISITINAINDAPEVTAGQPVSVVEGAEVEITAMFSDVDSSQGHTCTITWGDDSSSEGSVTEPQGDTPGTCSASHSYIDDDPSGTPSDEHEVTVKVADGGEPVESGSATLTATVRNAAPAIAGVTGPVDPVKVGTAVEVRTSFSDAGTQDAHTCSLSWGDSTPDANVTGAAGICTATHTYSAPGVYAVGVKATDDDTGSTTVRYEYVVVYDPVGGFVTGGGSIDSPEGAYKASPSLTGRANFGFVSRYKTGATVPNGSTEFQFHVAWMNFHSSTYEWLVVSGAKAQYKGTGTINGVGAYGFLLTAMDGQVTGGGGIDKFRIKIWKKSTGEVVYDNQTGDADDTSPTTAITGGSIVVHKGR